MLQLKWIWKNMKGKRAIFIIGLILSAVASSASVITPKLIQRVIDDVFMADKADSRLFFSLIGTLVAVVFLRSVIDYIRQLFLEESSQLVMVRIEKKLFSTLVSQDSQFFDRNRTGDVITRVTSDLDYIRHVMAGLSRSVVNAAFMLISSIAMLATMHLGLTVSMVILLPLVVVLTLGYTKYIRPIYVDLRNRDAKISTVAQENIAGNRVVKAFAREEFEKEKFTNCCEDYLDLNISVAVKNQLFSRALTFITDLLGVVLIIVGGYFVITTKGKTGIWQLTLGELAAFSSLRMALSGPMQELGNVANDWQRFLASAEKVMEIYYSCPRITDRNDSVTTEKRLEGRITFDHVSFSFKDKKVFDDISFDIKPNETIAIMGPTGSGKTALINLLCRMYDPDKGHIYIDGTDVHMWKLSKLHSSIGVAMQDVFLFSDTIKSNIAYGDPEMPQKEINEYSKVADAHEFIEKLDEQYETVVGERGVGLSGGQRQRIALARAIAVKPPILVLDDTTSAVDMETELRIQEELRNLDFPCTKIIIAQRISSVRKADRIFILSGGKIDIGTHDSLAAKPGYYREICKLQHIADLPTIEGETEVAENV